MGEGDTIEQLKFFKFTSIAAAIVVSTIALSAQAGVYDLYADRAKHLQLQLEFQNKLDAFQSTQVTGGTYDQLIDHAPADKDSRTFKQRYWVDATYAKGPNSPVIYFICGENTCSAGDMAGEPLNVAAKLGAYAVALEHRYYGKSQPFDMSAGGLSTANMKYLTIANALADLAAFETWARANLGLTGNWIAVGGSYSGALSAYYRALYPNMVVGALASSAPVQARENFEDYDRHVAEVAGPQCLAIIRQVVKATEAAIAVQSANPGELANIKSEFAAQKIQDSDDFLYLIADVGAAAVQYGMRDEFCNNLEVAQGPKGLDIATATQAYGQFAQEVYMDFGVDAWGFSFESAQSVNPADYFSGVGLRQWMYQSCTEFGFFQNAYHNPAQSMRSARINVNYHRHLCERLFGQDLTPDIAATNADFYEPVLKTASKILLTNGSNDPWSLLGITSANGNNVNPNLNVILIDGTSHCADMGEDSPADPPGLTAARRTFLDLAINWLKI